MKKFLLPVSCCKSAKWKDPYLGWSRHYGVIALRDRCDVLVVRDCSWDFYRKEFLRSVLLEKFIPLNCLKNGVYLEIKETTM